MHLYKLLACLALISCAFVCVVVHVTQKGTRFSTMVPPFRMGTWTGPFPDGDMDRPLSGGCPPLWGCSMVCLGKKIANHSKKSQFLPVLCVLCALCRHAPYVYIRVCI